MLPGSREHFWVRTLDNQFHAADGAFTEKLCGTSVVALCGRKCPLDVLFIESVPGHKFNDTLEIPNTCRNCRVISRYLRRKTAEAKEQTALLDMAIAMINPPRLEKPIEQPPKATSTLGWTSQTLDKKVHDVGDLVGSSTEHILDMLSLAKKIYLLCDAIGDLYVPPPQIDCDNSEMEFVWLDLSLHRSIDLWYDQKTLILTRVDNNKVYDTENPSDEAITEEIRWILCRNPSSSSNPSMKTMTKPNA